MRLEPWTPAWEAAVADVLLRYGLRVSWERHLAAVAGDPGTKFGLCRCWCHLQCFIDYKSYSFDPAYHHHPPKAPAPAVFANEFYARYLRYKGADRDE